jgi:hypothetical protein
MSHQLPGQQDAQPDSELVFDLSGAALDVDKALVYPVIVYVSGSWEDSKQRAVIQWLEKLLGTNVQHVVSDGNKHAVRASVAEEKNVKLLVEQHALTELQAGVGEKFHAVAQLPANTRLQHVKQAVAFQLFCPELSSAALQHIAGHLPFVSALLHTKTVHHSLSIAHTCAAVDALAMVDTAAYNKALAAEWIVVKLSGKVQCRVHLTSRKVISFAQLGTMAQLTEPRLQQMHLDSGQSVSGSKRPYAQAVGEEDQAESPLSKRGSMHTRSQAHGMPKPAFHAG